MKKFATRGIETSAVEPPQAPESGSSVARLKHLLDVPAEACFLGFALEHVETGNYLCLSRNRQAQSVCGWSVSPEKALFFRNWSETLRAAALRPEADIVLIFDIGDQLLVFPAR
jgi:hypothetical protein